MAVIRYKNPTDYAFLTWLGGFPESHHPLDTERFHAFVKTLCRYRSIKWQSYEYFQEQILKHIPTFSKNNIEHFWHQMQELSAFYKVPSLPTITDSFDKRTGIYQRGVIGGRRYEVQISEQEYFSRTGASTQTLTHAEYIDSK